MRIPFPQLNPLKLISLIKALSKSVIQGAESSKSVSKSVIVNSLLNVILIVNSLL